ncbi:ligase-associated DNA damage response endonuclease PdeM [Synechococcus sp. GreenBA-s]|nr:ligase-associated DNA damage response endonuclease PdeM [Synechococcus sp. GreenBA-s]
MLIWGESTLELLPQRALWLPGERLLLLADLHLGKAESFQAQGVPLPSDGDGATLNPLLELAHRLRPAEVLVLGDLIHSRLGLTAELRAKLAALPELLGCRFGLIGGNHERGSWIEGLPAQPSQRRGPLWLSHEPEPPGAPGLLNVCGHLHPVALLGGGRAGRPGADRLRLPCFALDPQAPRLLLPSFGRLTGGHPCPPGLRRWVVAEGTVLELPAGV